EEKLKAEGIFTNPTITINLQRGELFVSVGGNVRLPGRYPYTSDMTLLAAISAGGGPNDFAGDRVRLRREGRETTYSRKALQRDPGSEPKLLPGDQVEVDPSKW